MELDRQAFLKALKENEDDTATRLVYADWLEERGETEESERQRAWPAAKAWLTQFWDEAAKNERTEMAGYGPGWDDGLGFISSYEKMMEEAERVAKNGYEPAMRCGNSEWLCDRLRSNTDVFWNNVAIVTGYRLPETYDGWFSCAC